MTPSSPGTRAAYAVPPPGDRPHSIAVFGCTGNAGRAVAYHVLRSAARRPGICVALAGRSRDRVEGVLRSVLDELRSEGCAGVDGVEGGAVGIVVADASDDASMLALARSAAVVVSCAGPYARYGEAAVRACVEGGAHYVDITGEVVWVERMVADYGARAEARGVALCPFGGYDCVPAELGMWLVGKALDAGETGGEESDKASLGKLELNFRNGGGAGFPRGTLHTIMDGVEGNTPQRREGDPRFYQKEYRGVAKAALSFSYWVLPKYQLGQFVGPNIMSSINVPVLCRAAPTLGFSSNLSISDRLVVGGRPSFFNAYGLFKTQAYIIALTLGGVAISLPPFRWWLRGRMKTYSYGGDPSGRTLLDARGVSVDGGSTALAKCAFPGDCGIYATGLFASAVARALHEATSSGSTHPMPLAGFHSPVAALHGCREGLLVDYLTDAGGSIRVEVEEAGGEAREVDATKLRSKL